jgi:hypothetical protein
VAATGVRTTLRVIDWAANQGRGEVAPRWAGERTSVADRPTPVPPETTAATSTAVAQEAPAKKAPATKATAKKSPAKKSPAAKKAPAKKAAVKKAAVEKAPSARAATLAPALPPDAIEEVEQTGQQDGPQDDSPITPSGIPAADPGHNPDTTETDLVQPGTPPVMDPGTVQSVLSEAETLRKAADTDKG